MFLLSIIFSLCLAIFALAEPAPISRDSPAGVQYHARFDTGAIKGFLWFVPNDGLLYVVANTQGLPVAGGPYNYRIHQRKVPQSGNCRATFGVFDPYDGALRPATRAEYRVGDYSGKYGQIRTNPSLFTFLAAYSSLNPENPAFVGDKSVVITRADGTRVSCANIVRIPPREEMPQNVKDELSKTMDALKAGIEGK